MTDPVLEPLVDQAHFAFGGVSYPLPSQAAGASLLSVADPALSHLLAFCKSVITTYVGTALTTAAGSGAGPISHAVEQSIAIDPALVATAAALKFPLLALWRDDERMQMRTANWGDRDTRVRLAYILPALTAAQMIELTPVLAAVSAVITERVLHGSDPAYQSGATLFSLTTFEAAALESAAYGAYQWEGSDAGAGGIVFPAWTATLRLSERVMPDTNGLGVLSGATIDLVERPTDATQVDVEIDTDVG